jgi:hypothetical protein
LGNDKTDRMNGGIMKRSFYKIGTLLLLVTLFLFPFKQSLFARDLDAKDFVVFLTADVSKTPAPHITINWVTNGFANQFQVYKKLKSDAYWGNPIATLDSTAKSYTDNSVEVGKAYEYQVLAPSVVPVQDTILNYAATGYIYAGIEVQPIDHYGTVLLLIEENLQYYFSVKIKRLEDDMSAEGWNVIPKYVPRSDSTEIKATVIKNIIEKEYLKNSDINTVFILGRVPVPYSGDLNPDGHPNHLGAWPADLYYGVMDSTNWIDVNVNTDNNPPGYTPDRSANVNKPGDGKFDPSSISSGDVILGIGRVDFYNMPSFSKTEQELLEQYLDKDHAYRTGNVPVIMRGLVDINFQPSKDNYEFTFGASGWRNFSPFFGYDSIKNVDWFTTLSTDTYLWAYGCGGGWYQGAGGIGNTSQFASTNVNAIFTMLFGSYFGDWDSQDNFLRAGLCSSPSVLTCCWAGRPQWYLHQMALGEPISFSTMLSQNNYTTYIPNFIFTQYPNGGIATYGNLLVHTALMGDPTLRMFMGTVPAPTNLSVIQPAGGQVEINWQAPSQKENYVYNVFVSDSSNGPFTKINTDLIADTSFKDQNLKRDGSYHYMVRAYELQNTPSGSFYNPSHIIVSQAIQVTGVNETAAPGYSMTASPNPAYNNVNISLSLEKQSFVTLEVYDINGNRIINLCSRELASGTHSIAWNLTDSGYRKVAPGVYFVKLTGYGLSDAVKIIVMP